MIADWLMVPIVYLIREGKLNPEDRLDAILKKKAEEGIPVYCIDMG